MKRALTIFGLFLLLSLGVQLGSAPVDEGWYFGTPHMLLSPTPDPVAAGADDGWRPQQSGDLVGHRGPYWARVSVVFGRADFTHIRITGPGSYDAWWDGRFVGRNGRIAPDGQELEIGRVDALFSLPDDATEVGEHTLLLRISNMAAPIDTMRGSFDFLQPRDFPSYFMRQASVALLTTVYALTSAIVYLFLAFRHANRVQAVFVAFCVCFFILAVLEAWRSMAGYIYPLHNVRMAIIAVMTSLTGCVLSGFLVEYFKIYRYRWIVAALALAQILVWFPIAGSFDLYTALSTLLSVVVAVGVCALGWRAGHGAAPLMLGVLTGATAFNVLNFTYVDEWGVFVIFLAFTTAVNYALAQDMRALNRSLVEVELKSLRLREEIYRRFLQPHYLLNTLTAISEWIAQAPAEAEKAIGELANEARLLGRLVDQDLTPLSDEVELCQRHCAIMSRRLMTTFDLRVIGELVGTIPPAVLHTLVENVFTHNRYSADKVVLRLEARADERRSTLRLISPLGEATPPPSEARRDGQGGLRYVRARLTEAYGDDWSMEVRQEQGCWIAELVYPHGTHHGGFDTDHRG